MATDASDNQAAIAALTERHEALEREALRREIVILERMDRIEERMAYQAPWATTKRLIGDLTKIASGLVVIGGGLLAVVMWLVERIKNG